MLYNVEWNQVYLGNHVKSVQGIFVENGMRSSTTKLSLIFINFFLNKWFEKRKFFITWSCIRVLTTSRGFVKKQAPQAARPPRANSISTLNEKRRWSFYLISLETKWNVVKPDFPDLCSMAVVVWLDARDWRMAQRIALTQSLKAKWVDNLTNGVHADKINKGDDFQIVTPS